MARIEILKWNGDHEVSQSRKVKGSLPWVAVPTRQGRGYCRLVGEHGAAGLGVWLALLELAAARKVENRGTIEGTVEDAALMARLDPATVGAVLPALAQLGWIKLVDQPESPFFSPAPTTLPAGSQSSGPTVGPTERDGTERDGTGHREMESHGSAGDEPPAPRKARRPSPREKVSKALARALGASVAASSKQVAALVDAGHDLPDIFEGIAAHASPGLAPWDWTKVFLGARKPPADAYGGSATHLDCKACGGEALALTPDGKCMKCAAGGDA
jgi:hypothetical protein